MGGVLEGIRVLDFGRYIAGPYCATLLAEFGAEVIRVERRAGSEDRFVAPVGSGGEGALFLQVNRNKKCITLDPMKREGQEVMRRLVKTADVVVANLPPQTLRAMKLDYDSLKAIKPDIPQAWEALKQYVELSPPSLRPFNQLMGQMRVAAALARAGLEDSARSLARRSQSDPTIDPTRNLAELAVNVYANLGDYQEAVNQLSLYMAANPGLRESMQKDTPWYWRDLSEDPRYKALLGTQ